MGGHDTFRDGGIMVRVKQTKTDDSIIVYLTQRVMPLSLHNKTPGTS